MRRCLRRSARTWLWTLSSSVTSRITASALPFLRLIALTVVSRSLAARPAHSTVAPASARVTAMSRPRPREAPVTSAMRFLSEKRSAMGPRS